MPYVSSDGGVVQERSKFRLSIISDFLWTILDIAGAFIDSFGKFNLWNWTFFNYETILNQ